jgi:NAD(P)-dependent dehydrogenase (short-subunit alcohol dehydrogenase family)
MTLGVRSATATSSRFPRQADESRAYQSAKWAAGGFSEILAKEVGPLGIRVTDLSVYQSVELW